MRLPHYRAAVLALLPLAALPAVAQQTSGTIALAQRNVPRRPGGLPPWSLEERERPRQSTSMVVPDGELPGYETLRLRSGVETELGQRYLDTLPILRGDLFTTGTIFTDVPPDSPYQNLGLRELVQLAMRENLELTNQRRSTEISESSVRSAEANFIPFVDFVSDASIRQRRERVTRTIPATPDPLDPLAPLPDPEVVSEFQTNETITNSGGLEVRQNLQTGGTITANARSTRTETDLNTATADGDTNDRSYSSVASVRLDQPLLRGAGYDVATANLRRSRLSEAQSRIAQAVAERDTALQIIRSYFRILALKQQLQVSADAIVERKRFLDETVKKYELGRVAEGEILNAEIQYLQELEGAISRRQALEDERVNLVLLLGLPLETPISLVDITGDLRERGRVEVPAPDQAVSEALSSRPELVREEISVVLAELDTRVARNNRLPELNVTGGVQKSETDNQFDQANGIENDEWDVGASLRVPLINIQRREEHRRAILSLEQARTTRLQRERTIQREVLNTLRAVLATEANLSILQKTVEQARRNLDLTKGQYEVGFSSVTEVRLAQDDLFRAESRYTQALVDYQTSLAELYVALGRPLF